MADINDFYEVFVLGIIGNLLTDGPNAPFYKSLLESGMGQNFSPSTGDDSGLSLKLADPTNAVADLCLERAHTGSSVAAGIMGVKISAKPDLDGDTG